MEVGTFVYKNKEEIMGALDQMESNNFILESFSCGQIDNNYCRPKYVRYLQLLFGDTAKYYNESNSLLYGIQTEPEFEYVGDITYAITYYLIVTLGERIKEEDVDMDKVKQEHSNPEIKCKRGFSRGMMTVYKNYDNMTDGEKFKFYREYFEHDPNDILLVRCGGDKCRIFLERGGELCRDCYGDVNSLEGILMCMIYGLKLKDIPTESIVAIIKKVKIYEDKS